METRLRFTAFGMPPTSRMAFGPMVDIQRSTDVRKEEYDYVREDVPYELEDALTADGAAYSSAANWQPHVVVYGRLITGQNPASAGPLAKELLAAPKKRAWRTEFGLLLGSRKYLQVGFLSPIRYMTIWMVRSATWRRSVWRTPRPI